MTEMRQPCEHINAWQGAVYTAVCHNLSSPIIPHIRVTHQPTLAHVVHVKTLHSSRIPHLQPSQSISRKPLQLQQLTHIDKPTKPPAKTHYTRSIINPNPRHPTQRSTISHIHINHHPIIKLLRIRRTHTIAPPLYTIAPPHHTIAPPLHTPISTIATTTYRSLPHYPRLSHQTIPPPYTHQRTQMLPLLHRHTIHPRKILHLRVTPTLSPIPIYSTHLKRSEPKPQQHRAVSLIRVKHKTLPPVRFHSIVPPTSRRSPKPLQVLRRRPITPVPILRQKHRPKHHSKQRQNHEQESTLHRREPVATSRHKHPLRKYPKAPGRRSPLLPQEPPNAPET